MLRNLSIMVGATLIVERNTNHETSEYVIGSDMSDNSHTVIGRVRRDGVDACIGCLGSHLRDGGSNGDLYIGASNIHIRSHSL